MSDVYDVQYSGDADGSNATVTWEDAQGNEYQAHTDSYGNITDASVDTDGDGVNNAEVTYGADGDVSSSKVDYDGDGYSDNSTYYHSDGSATSYTDYGTYRYES